MALYEQNIEEIIAKGKGLFAYLQDLLDELNGQINETYVVDDVLEDVFNQHVDWQDLTKQRIIAQVKADTHKDLEVLQPVNTEVSLFGDKFFLAKDKGFVYGPTPEYNRKLRTAIRGGAYWKGVGEAVDIQPTTNGIDLRFEESRIAAENGYLYLVEMEMRKNGVSNEAIDDYTTRFLVFTEQVTATLQNYFNNYPSVAEARTQIRQIVARNLEKAIEEHTESEIKENDSEEVVCMKKAELTFDNEVAEYKAKLTAKLKEIHAYDIPIFNAVYDSRDKAYERYLELGGKHSYNEVEDELFNIMYDEAAFYVSEAVEDVDLVAAYDGVSFQAYHPDLCDGNGNGLDEFDITKDLSMSYLSDLVDISDIQEFFDDEMNRDEVISSDYDEAEVDNYIGLLDDFLLEVEEELNELIEMIDEYKAIGEDLAKQVPHYVNMAMEFALERMVDNEDDYS